MATSGAPQNGATTSFTVSVQAASDSMFVIMPNRTVTLYANNFDFDPFGDMELETADIGRLTATRQLPFETQLTGELMPVRIAEQVKADVRRAKFTAPIAVTITDERHNTWGALLTNFDYDMKRGLDFCNFKFDLLVTSVPATYDRLCA